MNVLKSTFGRKAYSYPRLGYLWIKIITKTGKVLQTSLKNIGKKESPCSAPPSLIQPYSDNTTEISGRLNFFCHSKINCNEKINIGKIMFKPFSFQSKTVP